jgi:hypothetical protein
MKDGSQACYTKDAKELSSMILKGKTVNGYFSRKFDISRTRLYELKGRTVKDVLNGNGCDIEKYAVFEFDEKKPVPIRTGFVKFYESENTIAIQAKPGKNMFVIVGTTKYGMMKQLMVMVYAEEPKLDCKEDQFTTNSRGFNRVIDF